MASSSAPTPERRRRGWQLTCEVLAALAVLCLAALGYLYFYVRGNQPQVDGELTLAGLQGPASVVRDELGVAHIRALSVHDLYLAMGFAMAQDRLWQMDLMRRLGEGRLAEVFGPVALPLDEDNRRLGLGRTAAREAAHLAPQEAALLDAFAKGVNDFIARRQNHLPLEFELLHYRPTPWKPQDSLALAAYMYQTLASDYKSKLIRESFVAKLGPVLGNQLFPDRSPWDMPPGVPMPGSEPVAQLHPPVFAAPPQTVAERGGSNNWVVSGARSFTGLPLLANDPHLEFQVPGLWWTVELRSPQLHVAGVAIAGVPGVIVGHNDRIAWGVTNSDADAQDLYRVTAADVTSHWLESITVKGQAPVKLDIAVTAHGPIITHDADGPLALAWTLYAPGALQATHVFLALGEAQSWQEFEQALSQFSGPAQNFVYADSAGHIGYQLAGWVPERRGFDGSVPVPGDQAAYRWQGWIPFDQLPRALDPASGMLATANSRITPDGYRHVISTDWDAPNRTRRIYELLGGQSRWNPQGFSRVQTDVVSEQDGDFAAQLVAAGRSGPAAGRALPANTRRALELLRGFGGAMAYESGAPTLTYWTRQELLHEVLAAKVGDAMARQYRWDEAPVFEQWLLRERPAAWLPPPYAATNGGGWNAFLLHCLTQVTARLTLASGALHWGHFQFLSVPHPVFSHLPFVRAYADLGPVEINGSPLTIKQARNPELGDKVQLGPSMRFIADPADWDRSELTLVTGESGLPFNSHYRDQFAAYLAGRGLPLWFSPAAVAAHTRHALELRPATGTSL
ncbi:MAG: penicillin acylase family protein [Terriglobales bacterium]